jgi:hypothetical protein
MKTSASTLQFPKVALESKPEEAAARAKFALQYPRKVAIRSKIRAAVICPRKFLSEGERIWLFQDRENWKSVPKCWDTRYIETIFIAYTSHSFSQLHWNLKLRYREVRILRNSIGLRPNG